MMYLDLRIPSSETDTMEYIAESPTSMHNCDFAMQKYILLQNQHDELRRHMRTLCPTTFYTTSSTAVTSPSVSPSRSFARSPSESSSTSPSRERHPRRSSLPASTRDGSGPRSRLNTVLDEDLVEEVVAGEKQLCDVNESIKRALTELLNCEAVRKDRTMRTWVQTRLMDTERELRTGRRRRSGGSMD